MTNPASSISSPEIVSLKNEIHTLETRLQGARTGQDWWNNLYLTLGWVAVLLATAFGIGSLYSQRKASRIEFNSRPDAEALAAKNSRLREVIDRAAQLEVATAQKDAEDAKERAGKAEQGASDATQRAAEASRAAEQERIERLKLEAQIQPRQYTAEEQEAIVEACAGFAGHSVVIRSLPYDVEGAVFATSLAELLTSRTALKINASGIGDNFMQNLPMVIDVHVIGPPTEQPLINALTVALATPRVTVAPPSPSPRLTIIVGGKRLAPPSIAQ